MTDSLSPGQAKYLVGSAAQWMRDSWVLTVLSVAAAAGLALVPFVLVDEAGVLTRPTGLRALIAFATLAALAVVLDRVADWHTRRVADLTAQAEITAGQKALTALLPLLDDIHAVAFEEGAAREILIRSLRSSVAVSAAQIPTASDVRATYYPLTRDSDGWRELRNPKSRGRADEASTEFHERQDPEHPVWNVIASRDSDCAIYSRPDTAPKVDWDARPYDTFVSVPVRAGDVVFGMLSVNAPVAGDLTELDRLAVIAVARTMAAALAINEGPRKLRRTRRDEPDAASIEVDE